MAVLHIDVASYEQTTILVTSVNALVQVLAKGELEQLPCYNFKCNEQTLNVVPRRECNPQREMEFTELLLKASENKQVSNLKSP